MSNGTFIIVFSRGQRDKIDVVNLSGCEHERSDYSCASIHTFHSEKSAAAYARELAKKHSVSYSGVHSELDADEEDQAPAEIGGSHGQRD